MKLAEEYIDTIEYWLKLNPWFDVHVSPREIRRIQKMILRDIYDKEYTPSRE